MFKVAILTGSDLRTYGGGEKEAIGIANSLADLRVSIFSFRDIANLRLTDDEIGDMIAPSVKVRYYDSFFFRTHRDLNPFTLNSIRAIFSLRSFNTVYSMHPGFLTNGVLLILSRIFRFKFVFGIHSPIYFEYFPEVKGIAGKLLTRAFSGVRKYLIGKMKYIRIQNKRDQKNLEGIGFSGSIYNVTPYIRKFEAVHRISESLIFKVLFVGRLVTGQKGLDLYISIMENVLRRNSDIKFVLVGSGKEGERLLQKMLSEYPGRVEMKGFLSESNLEEIYYASNMFAFPSRSENFGISLCEALMAGLPAIAFKVMGVEEILNDENFGTLIEPFNIDAFSNEIIKMHDLWKSDKSSYLARMKYIREKALERFGCDTVLEGLKEMFIQV